MKHTVLRYGLLGASVILGISMFQFFVFRDKLDYSIQEVIGYLTIFLSMIFVFLGIRHYRDHHAGGTLSFGKGLKVGLLIVLIPSLAFGLFDIIYTRVINPAWREEYMDHSLRQLQQTVPADQLAAREEAFRKSMELFSNPIAEFFLMFLTVFIIGLIVSIIAALALRRKEERVAPAEAVGV